MSHGRQRSKRFRTFRGERAVQAHKRGRHREDRQICRYHHKWNYATYEQCAEACRHSTERDEAKLQPHWCPIEGVYHMTSSTEQEYNRRQAEGLARRLAEEREQEEEETG